MDRNEECYVKFVSPMWYPVDNEAEIAKKQVIYGGIAKLFNLGYNGSVLPL